MGSIDTFLPHWHEMCKEKNRMDKREDLLAIVMSNIFSFYKVLSENFFGTLLFIYIITSL